MFLVQPAGGLLGKPPVRPEAGEGGHLPPLKLDQSPEEDGADQHSAPREGAQATPGRVGRGHTPSLRGSLCTWFLPFPFCTLPLALPSELTAPSLPPPGRLAGAVKLIKQ